MHLGYQGTESVPYKLQMMGPLELGGGLIVGGSE